jgi:hypothetical protein
MNENDIKDINKEIALLYTYLSKFLIKFKYSEVITIDFLNGIIRDISIIKKELKLINNQLKRRNDIYN